MVLCGLSPQQAGNALVDLNYDTIQGAFVLDARNDIDIQGTIASVKKRVVRRLITQPGGFFHLPDYGLSIDIKKLASTTDLAMLAVNAKEQVAKEEEIETVNVEVEQLTTGTFVIRVDARTVSGASVKAKVGISDDGTISVE